MKPSVHGRAPFLVTEDLERLVFTSKLVAGLGVDPRSPSSVTGPQTGCQENPLECLTKMQSPRPCLQRFRFGSWGPGMGIFIKFNIRVMQRLGGVRGPYSRKHCSRPYYFHKTQRYSPTPALPPPPPVGIKRSPTSLPLSDRNANQTAMAKREFTGL